MHCRALLRVLFLPGRRRGDGQRLRMIISPLPDLPLLPEGIFLLLDAVREFGFRSFEADIEFVVLVGYGGKRSRDGIE